ncbi:MAG: hypothetical protein ABI443_14290 [Chthoniobacterales bacterium]
MLVGTASAQIYVTVSGGVNKYDITSHSGSTFVTGLGINIYGVAVDSAGNVYVGDYGNAKITKYTSGYTSDDVFGTPYSGTVGSGDPFGVGVLGSNVYFALRNTNQFAKVDTSGGFPNLNYATGGGASTNIAAYVAFDPTGTYMC